MFFLDKYKYNKLTFSDLKKVIRELMDEKRKKFDRDFKINAVKTSYHKRTLKEYADELGILPYLLTMWRQVYAKYGEGSFLGSGYERVHPQKRTSFELEKKCKEAEIRYEILKKGSPYLHQGKLVIYGFLLENEQTYSITKMCSVLEIGIGRYIHWKKRGISDHEKKIFWLKKEITFIFFHFKKRCGSGKITAQLNANGYKITARHVSLYMKKLGLRKIKKRKFKVTTDSKHNHYTSPNILNRNFHVTAPSKVWASDITYIQTLRGFIYLTIIMDLYDRKIIGWNLSNTLFTNTTTLPALKMAAAKRGIYKGLIFHSDRGVQYANKAFTDQLDSYGCIKSMNRKGDHFDNAVCESFFSSFKKELIYRKKTLLYQKQMEEEIVDYIENWYNMSRIHSTLNYQSIEQFNSGSPINKI